MPMMAADVAEWRQKTATRKAQKKNSARAEQKAWPCPCGHEDAMVARAGWDGNANGMIGWIGI